VEQASRRATLLPPLPRGVVSGKEIPKFRPPCADSIGCGGVAVFSIRNNDRSAVME
jgi:hypothetical protein